MPVNGPFALVARLDALRVEPRTVPSDRSDVFGTPDIPMIQSKLPSRINKDVLPSNKKKDAYKSSSDLYRKCRHFVQVLKKPFTYKALTSFFVTN